MDNQRCRRGTIITFTLWALTIVLYAITIAIISINTNESNADANRQSSDVNTTDETAVLSQRITAVFFYTTTIVLLVCFTSSCLFLHLKICNRGNDNQSFKRNRTRHCNEDTGDVESEAMNFPDRVTEGIEITGISNDIVESVPHLGNENDDCFLIGNRVSYIDDEELEASKSKLKRCSTDNSNIVFNSKRYEGQLISDKSNFVKDQHESVQKHSIQYSLVLNAASLPQDDLVSKTHTELMKNTSSPPWSIQQSNTNNDYNAYSYPKFISTERSYTKLNENELARRTTGNQSSYASNQSKMTPPECCKHSVDGDETGSRLTTQKISSINNTPLSEPRIQCKENLSDLNYNVKVSIVKPLTSADEKTSPTEQNAAQKDIDVKTRLDWDKVFRFLVQNLPAMDYKLFFISLFGEAPSHLPKEMDVSAKISQIECDVKAKSGGTSCLIFELFKSWKQILGTQADTTLIENALSEMQYNDIWSRFRDFMREPPLLPLKLETTKTSYEYPEKRLDQTMFFNTPMQQESHVLALHDTVQAQLCIGCRSNFRLQTHEENRIALVCHNKRNQLMIEDTPGTSGQCAYNVSESLQVNERRKRQWADTFSSESESDGRVCKYTRTDEYSPFLFQRSNGERKETRDEQSKQKKTSVPWEIVDENFIINLIKRFLPLGCQMLTAGEYRLFMHHTISVIMQKTSESEDVVTSIQIDDFEDMKEMKTKRGHVSYSIDTEKALLTLGQEEWDCLRLYTKYARESVLKRLKMDESKLASTRYLFLEFDGHAVIEKNIINEAISLKEDVSISMKETAQDNSAKTEQVNT
ncbi:uncharacterized protein LOC128559453 [Mercenaria mercenaria]|uniref:uncharacterized protein LOC128559453 n=1 Tax=Mercenaria mercenaria TaxID=6596 RepID=UPI00234F8B63|nr:uncharacterized protein LOC128559453 [Mercenaria mercenaria]XP_053407144.1 uncharacterized protein LOC128559453 [Mercenaria mercenaria]